MEVKFKKERRCHSKNILRIESSINKIINEILSDIDLFDGASIWYEINNVSLSELEVCGEAYLLYTNLDDFEKNPITIILWHESFLIDYNLDIPNLDIFPAKNDLNAELQKIELYKRLEFDKINEDCEDEDLLIDAVWKNVEAMVLSCFRKFGKEI
mgnify:CR=1 FL=1